MEGRGGRGKVGGWRRGGPLMEWDGMGWDDIRQEKGVRDGFRCGYCVLRGMHGRGRKAEGDDRRPFIERMNYSMIFWRRRY